MLFIRRKTTNVLVSNSHYKNYKQEELEMVFGKKPIVCKLGDFGEARSMYTQTNALTDKKFLDTLQTHELSFTSGFSICMTVPLNNSYGDKFK